MRAEWAAERPDLDTSPIEVVGRIGRVSRRLDAGMNAVLADHGLRRDTFDVLAALRRSGPPYELSPSDLYDRLMRSSGAVTNRLRRLEREGLVSRHPDPEDGRGLLVRLTARGRRAIDAATPPHLGNERRMLEALSTDEQRTLGQLLKTLLLSLEG